MVFITERTIQRTKEVVIKLITKVIIMTYKTSSMNINEMSFIEGYKCYTE